MAANGAVLLFLHSENTLYTLVWLQETWNSRMSDVPNTHAREQQEWHWARKKREKEGRRWTLGDTERNLAYAQAQLLQFKGTRLPMQQYLYWFTLNSHCALYNMAIINVELPHEWSSTHECYRKLGTHPRVPPRHPGMGTAETQPEKEKDEEGKSRGANMERSKAGTRERKKVPTVTADPAK